METVFRLLDGVRRRLTRTRDDSGFTLIELMVAMGVILASLMTLAYTASIGFSDIALARQRDGANGVANQTMEQVRALPFDTLKRGLATSDLPGGDSSIVTTGCPNAAPYCYRAAASGTLEEIPRGTNANVVPLVPHRATLTVGQTAYTRSVYVTYYNNDATLNAFRVTVVVTWTNPARRGVASSVTVQSVMYSPLGVSTATHPFAAPAQPFFYGLAHNQPGSVAITGTVNGLSLASANLWLPVASSNMQVEQISAVQGSVTTAGSTLTLADGSTSSAGQVGARSAADNDPTQPASDYSTATASGGAQTVSTSGSGNALNLTLSAGNTAATTSTTNASATHPCNSQTDSQPCGTSTSGQTASLSAGLGLNSGFLSLGTANLASIASYSATSTTDRVADTTDGRVAATASRTIGDLRVGGLPGSLSALLTPLGWQGYLVRVASYTDSVSAQFGTNTSAPAVTATGTVSVWNGFGYTNVTIPVGAGVTVPVTSLTVQDPLSPGGLLKVVLSATVRTGGTASSSTVKTCTPTPCLNTRTAAAASSASPVIVDYSIKVTLAGSTIADVAVHLDMGTLEASGSYKESPSA
jgi:prepilin-type N-terminal cleavage/methylation domain-containing protein